MDILSEVERLTGPPDQLAPLDEQIVGNESQITRQLPSTVVPIQEPDKRMEPLPVSIVPTAEPGAAAAAAAAGYFGELPVLQLNRYIGIDTSWVEILRWDIPDGFMGDLHEIAINTTLDAKTRYQLVLANLDQNIPTDRDSSTPLTFTWRNCKIPPGTSVVLRILSTDGTSITVDASLTGTLRPLPTS